MFLFLVKKNTHHCLLRLQIAEIYASFLQNFNKVSRLNTVSSITTLLFYQNTFHRWRLKPVMGQRYINIWAIQFIFVKQVLCYFNPHQHWICYLEIFLVTVVLLFSISQQKNNKKAGKLYIYKTQFISWIFVLILPAIITESLNQIKVQTFNLIFYTCNLLFVSPATK